MSDELSTRMALSEPMKVIASAALTPCTSMFSGSRNGHAADVNQVSFGEALEETLFDCAPQSCHEGAPLCQSNDALLLENMQLLLQNAGLHQAIKNLESSRQQARGGALEGTCFLPADTTRSGMERPDVAIDDRGDASYHIVETLRRALKVASQASPPDAASPPNGNFYVPDDYNRMRQRFGAASPPASDEAQEMKHRQGRNLTLSCASAPEASLSLQDRSSSLTKVDSLEGTRSLPTTVMMRNIPNNYTRTRLLDLLNSEGFLGAYDFLYLPMDFQTEVGLGYAFINLVNHNVATRFHDYFQGFSSWSLQSDKVCQMSWSDIHQGLQAHIDRYLNSPVMHDSVPDRFKPVLFTRGVSITFPKPTAIIRPPRLRKFPAKNKK